MSIKTIKVFDEETVDEILKAVLDIEESKWFHIPYIENIRSTTDDPTSSYDKCNFLNIPKNLKNKLIKLAPKISFYECVDIVINRYQIGGFLPPHKDKSLFLANVIVPLQSKKDGLTVESEFYEDEAGVGFILDGETLIHEVKPVKNLRYTVIFLMR